MAIPDFQSIMLPLLKFISDEKEHGIGEAVNYISEKFELNDEEKRQLLPSGKQIMIDNRVGWSRTYMKKAGLLDSPRRGVIKITEKGLEILKNKPEKINVKFLEQFPGFVEFRTLKKEKINGSGDETDQSDEMETETPDEMMGRGYNIIRADLGQELLSKVRNNTPNFFEGVVLDLLSAMGYGEGMVTGRTGDGGIDGVVNQDKLGIDKILFQAKRFSEGNNVAASMIRDFVGTLDLKGSNKGVFITTSKFPSNSEDIISRSQKRIILIDGNKLVDLMMDYNIGVATEKEYKIKKLDLDYFPEE